MALGSSVLCLDVFHYINPILVCYILLLVQTLLSRDYSLKIPFANHRLHATKTMLYHRNRISSAVHLRTHFIHFVFHFEDDMRRSLRKTTIEKRKSSIIELSYNGNPLIIVIQIQCERSINASSQTLTRRVFVFDIHIS